MYSPMLTVKKEHISVQIPSDEPVDNWRNKFMMEYIY